MNMMAAFYGALSIAAFALFVGTLGLVSWQTESYLRKHDGERYSR